MSTKTYLFYQKMAKILLHFYLRQECHNVCLCVRHKLVFHLSLSGLFKRSLSSLSFLHQTCLLVLEPHWTAVRAILSIIALMHRHTDRQTIFPFLGLRSEPTKLDPTRTWPKGFQFPQGILFQRKLSTKGNRLKEIWPNRIWPREILPLRKFDSRKLDPRKG